MTNKEDAIKIMKLEFSISLNSIKPTNATSEMPCAVHIHILIPSSTLGIVSAMLRHAIPIVANPEYSTHE